MALAYEQLPSAGLPTTIEALAPRTSQPAGLPAAIEALAPRRRSHRDCPLHRRHGGAEADTCEQSEAAFAESILGAQEL